MSASRPSRQQQTMADWLRPSMRALPAFLLALLLTGLPEAGLQCARAVLTGRQAAISQSAPQTGSSAAEQNGIAQAATSSATNSRQATPARVQAGKPSCCQLRLTATGTGCQCTALQQQSGVCCCRSRGPQPRVTRHSPAVPAEDSAAAEADVPHWVSCCCCGADGDTFSPTAAQPKLPVELTELPRTDGEISLQLPNSRRPVRFRSGPELPPPQLLPPDAVC